MISPSKRREFLDEIISIDYEYVETLKQFRKVLKQRNAYLKNYLNNSMTKVLLQK